MRTASICNTPVVLEAQANGARRPTLTDRNHPPTFNSPQDGNHRLCLNLLSAPFSTCLLKPKENKRDNKHTDVFLIKRKYK